MVSFQFCVSGPVSKLQPVWLCANWLIQHLSCEHQVERTSRMWLLSRGLRIVNYLSCIGGAVLMSCNVFLELTVVHTMLLFYSMETWEKKKNLHESESIVSVEHISKKKKNILCPYSSFPPTLEQNKGLKHEILSCAHEKQCFFCFCLCPLHITQTNIQKRHVPNSIIMCALFSSWTVKSHSTWEIENWGHLLLISINQILVITVDENKY